MPDSGRVLYSRGYSTVFGEWRTTDEAKDDAAQLPGVAALPDAGQAGAAEGVRRATPPTRFVPVWSVRVDPQALDVERVARPAPAKPIAIRDNGDPSRKVDLLLLGDGYAADEMDKFEAQARALADHLFSVSPFKERAADFNVWALAVPVPVSGVSRPSTGLHRASRDRRRATTSSAASATR